MNENERNHKKELENVKNDFNNKLNIETNKFHKRLEEQEEKYKLEKQEQIKTQ